MDSFEACFECDAALVFGIGGSGDIVGSIPTARLLERHGLEVTLGGLTWEPVPKDTRPGPRPFEVIEGIERVSETVGLATEETRTYDGLEFAETAVARHYGTETILIDISPGVEAVRRGIDAAARRLDIDLVVGVDAGGDVLAKGNEPGLRSPVADGIGIVALDELETNACLGVFGYGSDGELTPDELDSRVESIAARDGILGAWGLTPRVRDELEAVLEHVETEASRIPLEASRGNFGPRDIRNGAVTAHLSPMSPITLYFDPAPVASTSGIADAVRGTSGLDAATEALEEMGLQSEFETERQRLEER